MLRCPSWAEPTLRDRYLQSGDPWGPTSWSWWDPRQWFIWPQKNLYLNCNVFFILNEDSHQCHDGWQHRDNDGEATREDKRNVIFWLWAVLPNPNKTNKQKTGIFLPLLLVPNLFTKYAPCLWLPRSHRLSSWFVNCAPASTISGPLNKACNASPSLLIFYIGFVTPNG